jgi:hypothetical protein
VVLRGSIMNQSRIAFIHAINGFLCMLLKEGINPKTAYQHGVSPKIIGGNLKRVRGQRKSEIVFLYAICNGETGMACDGTLLDGMSIMALNDAMERYDVLRETYSGFSPNEISGIWSMYWFPFATDVGGNLLCQSFDSGEIVYYENYSDRREIISKNMAGYLQEAVALIGSGKYLFNKTMRRFVLSKNNRSFDVYHPDGTTE